MGTLVAVTVHAPGTGGVSREESIAAAAFDEMRRLEGILSEFDPSSDLASVNAAAGRRPVRVAPELLEVAETALEVARVSGGAFDPTWRPLGEIWDFTGRTARVPSWREVAERLARVGYRDVLLDRHASTIELRRPGMSLGLGGVAKAFVAERAAQLAMSLGASGVLVDAGGDLVARGTNGARPWRVAVRDPRMPGASLGSLELRDAALATSADTERCFVARGRRHHHLLDPRSGRPARGVRSASVLGPRGSEADALATALFVLGPTEGARLLSAFPGASALWVPDGARPSS